MKSTKGIRWRILAVTLLPAGTVARAIEGKRFEITSFGAVGDGKTSNTQAIQR